MKVEQGFWQKDLVVYSYSNEQPWDIQNSIKIDRTGSPVDVYRFLFILRGDSVVQVGKTRKNAKGEILAIAEPGQQLSFDRLSNHPWEYLMIYAHPILFKNVIGDCDFLRIFTKTIEEQRFFYPIEWKSQFCRETLFSIKECLFRHFDRVHIQSRVFSLISELDAYIDLFKQDDFFGSDNLSVNICEYINKHYSENITLKMLEKKFFISSTSINKILKNSVNGTFLIYLNYIRVCNAKEMIKSQKITAKHAAELCGYSTYSTFFREYKKVFKISPTEQNQK